MPKAKKQPVKKRAYKKRKNILKSETITIPNTDSSEWIPKVKATNKDTEVESLVLICSIFDNWSMEQKQRNLKYIVGRYCDFM